jgi:PAS domain S-box-containing protein
MPDFFARASTAAKAETFVVWTDEEQFPQQLLDGRLAAIFECSDDAIIRKDLGGFIRSWNPGAERLFGYSAEEVVGRPITIIIPEDRLDEEPRILARLRAGKTIDRYQTVRRRKDGSLIDISLTVSPVKDASGKVIGAAKIARDITGEKRTQAALARRIEQQTALYHLTDRLQRAESIGEIHDAALAAIRRGLLCDRAAILLLDPSGVMRFVASTGLSEDYRWAVEGHSPWTLDTRDGEHIAVDDVATADIAPALRETIQAEGIQALAFTPISAGGRVIGKLTTCYGDAHAFSSDELDLALAIARQLGFGIERVRAQADRHRAEQELRESEMRKSAILASSLDAIVTMDEEGRIVDFNPAAEQMLGYDRMSAVGKTVAELMIPRHLRADHWRGVRSFLATGKSSVVGRRMDVQVLRSDRTEFAAELAVTSSHLESGRVLFTAFLRDITELRNAQEARRRERELLQSSNAMLRRERDNKLMTVQAAMASISHEIKQPLAAIEMNGAAIQAFLEHAPPDLEEARSASEAVVDDVHRTVQILDKLRQMFGKGQRESEPIDVNKLAHAALRLLQGELADHGVATAVTLASGLPPVMGNAIQLQEIILNLIHNAIEAMATVEGGRRHLEVRTRPDGNNEILIEVEDTGQGIEPERLNSIFEAFVTTKPRGMGLGLAICRTIVEQHGGKLTATSDGKSGALFQVSLPNRPGS